MRLSTRLLKFLSCKLFFRVKLYNEEILDKYKTFVICPNHSSVFDPAFVFPKKFENDVYIIAKQELFKQFWFKPLAKLYNLIPINRENTDVRSMLKSLDVFKQNPNAKLIIFPEGQVVKAEEDVGKIYKKGATFIAAYMEKPIIPVYISRRPKLFSTVKVIFCSPLFIKKEDIKGIGKIEEQTKLIIDKIYEMRQN